MTETKIVLAMHDGLSSGFVKAASHFIANPDFIEFPLYEDMTLEEYAEDFEQLLNIHQNILVLTDILPGACTITLAKKLKHASFSIVTGVNLSMILEAADLKDSYPADEIAKFITQAGISDIKILTDTNKE